jgi:fatty-acyl-CoA synthase
MVNISGRSGDPVIERAIRGLRGGIELAWVSAALGVRSGLVRRATPRGALALLRERLKGALGITSLFRIHAANSPEAIAVVHEGRALSYRELEQRIERLAGWLRAEHGIARGDAALLVMHNRPEVIEVQSALARLGAAAVSASPRSTPRELRYLVEHSGAKTIFFEAQLATAVLEGAALGEVSGASRIVIGGDPIPGTTRYEALASRPGAIPPVDESSEEDAAVVVYTSGTTGAPKGAVRRFPKESQLAMLQTIAELDLRHDDRHLVLCPLYHTTALAFASFTFALGGTVVIESKFDPERALARIAEHRITTTAVVPTMLHRILELPREVRRRHDLRSLRAIFSGGAPLSGRLARDVIRELGPVLHNFYGATETGLNTHATPGELLRAPGTIGHAVAGSEIRILDDDGRECAPGTTGELFVRNTMLVDYHRDAEATRASMRDGFFSVGDLAHRSAGGLFFIDGRKRDVVISGGVNVYPAEVEEVLAQHPAVGEAAVVGIPDDEWGERVRAYVAPRAGASLEVDEVIAWCRARLAGPKVPREVRVVAELPKNATGKVLKRELRQRD